MHGCILNGFLSYFIGECLPSKYNNSFTGNAFKNAVYLNDELQFEAVIQGIHETVNVIEFKYYFKNTEAKIVAKGKFK